MDLNKLNNANVGKNRIARLCLEHVYILKLLNYYKIQTLENVDALEQVIFFKYLMVLILNFLVTSYFSKNIKVDGNKISWILGFLINELNSDKGLLY